MLVAFRPNRRLELYQKRIESQIRHPNFVVKRKQKVSEVSAFFREQHVRALTLAFLLVVGAGLVFASLFFGEDGLKSAFQLGVFGRLLTQARGFKLDEWISLITPAVALSTAWFAHYGDETYEGRGIKDIVRKMGKTSYNLETDVITGSMTKQSVLAAIASILVAVVQQYPNQSNFGALIKFLATCGFGFTILFLLVSMACYDYASRFRWKTFTKRS